MKTRSLLLDSRYNRPDGSAVVGKHKAQKKNQTPETKVSDAHPMGMSNHITHTNYDIT